MNLKNKTEIMDVTLRDGSYSINFQFSEYETGKIVQGVERSGISYIEIGHGVGLGGSTPENGLALCSDEEYIAAAKRVIKDAKFGMFCIPGTAKIEDLSVLSNGGGSFVRVGTNVTEVHKSEAYIKEAKRLGLEVMANYMKSYTATPEEFAEKVKQSEAYGADVVYLVDSAGSMNADDVKRYHDAIRKVSKIRVGFHGHNNLGLAVSNSLVAMEEGYDIVDTSLLGMGRSAGNAATELVVANMVKNGIDKYDLKALLNCAEHYVKPLWKHQANSLDLYCGIAEFHTSYMKYIHRYSAKYQVNPLDLIMEYTKFDKVNMDVEKLEEIARKMPVDENCILTDFGFNEYIGNEQKN